MNDVKDYLIITQAIVIIIGFLGGVGLFIFRRKGQGKLILIQEINHYFLSEEKVLVRVKIIFENKGEGLLRIGKGSIWLQQIFPIIQIPEIDKILTSNATDEGPTEKPWPRIGDYELNKPFMPREIEPSEKDEINVDFVVNNQKTTLLSYIYIDNPKRKKIGWQQSTVYEVSESNEVEVISTQGVAQMPNLSSTNQPAKKIITPDPDDGSKGGPIKPKPPKVQQPAKPPKKKP